MPSSTKSQKEVIDEVPRFEKGCKSQALLSDSLLRQLLREKSDSSEGNGQVLIFLNHPQKANIRLCKLHPFLPLKCHKNYYSTLREPNRSHLKISLPKRTFHLPSINFQGVNSL